MVEYVLAQSYVCTHLRNRPHFHHNHIVHLWEFICIESTCWWGRHIKVSKWSSKIERGILAFFLAHGTAHVLLAFIIIGIVTDIGEGGR